MGFIKSCKEIIMFLKGKSYKVSSESESYTKIEQMLESNVSEEDLLSEVSAVEKVKKVSKGFIDIINEEVFFKNEKVPLDCARHILQLHESGEVDDRFILFLENLMNNPDKEARKDLYSFILKGKMPITEDGHFCAYRVVSHDWKDKYTRTMDNSIGSVVFMPRDKCNSNRNETCSAGLHFCSRSYINEFMSSGDHLVIVKINPADVVSIPVDYNESKGRCCKFIVLTEIKPGDRIESNIIDTSIYNKKEEQPPKVKREVTPKVKKEANINISSDTKECSCCHQVKSLSEFTKRSDVKSGYRGECKVCLNTKARERKTKK